jgi:hypothetical protein
MSPDSRAVYRERAGVASRALLAIGIAPALLVIWRGTGLPGVPGPELGSPGAQADSGPVVRIGDAQRAIRRASADPWYSAR